jgi:hypothetical protein
MSVIATTTSSQEVFFRATRNLFAQHFPNRCYVNGIPALSEWCVLIALNRQTPRVPSHAWWHNALAMCPDLPRL